MIRLTERASNRLLPLEIGANFRYNKFGYCLGNHIIVFTENTARSALARKFSKMGSAGDAGESGA